MNNHRKGERGGIDLIQIVVALMIIGIAAATATFSMYIGKGAIETEFRKKRALQLARDEVEFWIAKAYWGDEGVQLNPMSCALTYSRVETLDPRGNGNNDDIECDVIREPITKSYSIAGQDTIIQYKIIVNVVWDEPYFPNEAPPPPDTVSLQTWMVFYYSIAN
ncbi:type II secretion system protein [bacterium]|nr:type II secretion system protein [bacterium]